MTKRVIFCLLGCSTIFLVLVIGITSLHKNRFRFMDTQSMDYNVEGKHITSICYNWGDGDDIKAYTLYEVDEIDEFLKQLNSLEVIEVDNQFDFSQLGKTKEDMQDIVFYVYSGDECLSRICIFNRFIIVMHGEYERSISQYIIKDNCYIENPKNLFVRYYDNRYLNYEMTNEMKDVIKNKPSKTGEEPYYNIEYPATKYPENKILTYVLLIVVGLGVFIIGYKIFAIKVDSRKQKDNTGGNS